MAWNVFLLLPGSPYPLPAGGTGEGYLCSGEDYLRVRDNYLWVKILGPPAQLLLLCPEDPLLQSLVEGPQELASCQHTVTNSLDREERKRH